MRIVKYFNVTAALLLCSLSMFLNISLATEQPPTELRAFIMEIDLKNDLMVVAEKDIHLLAQIVNGKKVWKTIFVDAQGNPIPAQTYKEKDRVLVRGEESASGAIVAHEIIKFSEQSTEKKKPSSTNPENSNSYNSLPPEIRLEGGVWKN